MMNNYMLYKRYVGMTYGQNWWTIRSSEIFGIFYAMYYDSNEHLGTVCSDSFFESKTRDGYSFSDCMESSKMMDTKFFENED